MLDIISIAPAAVMCGPEKSVGSSSDGTKQCLLTSAWGRPMEVSVMGIGRQVSVMGIGRQVSVMGIGRVDADYGGRQLGGGCCVTLEPPVD